MPTLTVESILIVVYLSKKHYREATQIDLLSIDFLFKFFKRVPLKGAP